MNSQVSAAFRGQDIAVVDTSKLEIGDVLLSTSTHIISLGIRLATWSAVSHASLHVGGGFLVEAVEGGVRRTHCRSLVYSKMDHIQILRPVRASKEQRYAAADYAGTLVYRPYSTRGAIGSRVKFCRVSDDPGRFCSQVVAESYAKIGAPLTDGSPLETTPKDLLNSQRLEPVSIARRRAHKPDVLHALQQMIPDIVQPRIPAQGYQQISAEDFEARALRSAEAVMARFTCFRPPYHLIDVVRQMVAMVQEQPAAAQAVDEALAESFRECGAALHNGVLPRSTIPGVVNDTPDLDSIFVIAYDSDEERSETIRLREELLASRAWDLTEWEQTIDGYRKWAHETKLQSITAMEFWILGDFGRVQATYDWLANEN